jgi:hypothetical protein
MTEFAKHKPIKYLMTEPIKPPIPIKIIFIIN